MTFKRKSWRLQIYGKMIDRYFCNTEIPHIYNILYSCKICSTMLHLCQQNYSLQSNNVFSDLMTSYIEYSPAASSSVMALICAAATSRTSTTGKLSFATNGFSRSKSRLTTYRQKNMQQPTDTKICNNLQTQKYTSEISHEKIHVCWQKCLLV